MGRQSPQSPADGFSAGAPDAHEEVATLVSRALGSATVGRDRDAFAELIRRYETMALGVAYSVLGDASAAGDVAQDAFLRAWDRLDALKDPARFGAWLSGVVRNGAIDARRRRRIQPRSIGNELAIERGEPQVGGDARWALDPGEELDRRERRDLLRSALADLDEVSRTAVTLRYYEGLSSKEIGDRLGLAATAVDMRLSRARQQLRRKLQESGAFAGETRPG